jgi:surface antigen
MSMKSRIPVAVLFIGALSTISPAPTYAQVYSSPQQAAQNACQALGPKALSGAVMGAVGGGLLGAGIGGALGGRRGAAIGGGAGMFGGLLGGLSAGKQADQRDCLAAQAALAQLASQPTGVPVTWQSPSGSHGSYTPTGPEYQQGNQFCRPVREDTAIAGHQPTQIGAVTCRTANGDYQTVTETASNTGNSPPAN